MIVKFARNYRKICLNRLRNLRNISVEFLKFCRGILVGCNDNQGQQAIIYDQYLKLTKT